MPEIAPTGDRQESHTSDDDVVSETGSLVACARNGNFRKLRGRREIDLVDDESLESAALPNNNFVAGVRATPWHLQPRVGLEASATDSDQEFWTHLHDDAPEIAPTDDQQESHTSDDDVLSETGSLRSCARFGMFRELRGDAEIDLVDDESLEEERQRLETHLRISDMKLALTHNYFCSLL